MDFGAKILKASKKSMSDHLRLIVLASRVYEPSRDIIHKRVEYACVRRPDALSAHFQWGEQLSKVHLCLQILNWKEELNGFGLCAVSILPVEGLANLNPKMGIANNII